MYVMRVSQCHMIGAHVELQACTNCMTLYCCYIVIMQIRLPLPQTMHNTGIAWLIELLFNSIFTYKLQ